MTSTKRTLQEVEAEIAETKAKLEAVRGDETEVYARIVGYYRAVRNWNKGKRDEFNHRKLFELKEMNSDTKENKPEISSLEKEIRISEVASENMNASCNAPEATCASTWSYQIFTRPGCPHCPPVSKYMENSSLAGTKVNVDTDEGMNLAAELGVFSTPTVVFYNESGSPIARAHSVDEIEALLAPVDKTSALEEAIA